MRFSLLVGVSLAGLVLAVGAPAPASAAGCVAMNLFDQHGAVVPTPTPVIGMLLGGVPVLDGVVPPHFSRKPGAPAPCPEILVEKVRGLFNASCPSEERRKQAAAKNNSTISDINTGCANMAEALSAPTAK